MHDVSVNEHLLCWRYAILVVVAISMEALMARSVRRKILILRSAELMNDRKNRIDRRAAIPCPYNASTRIIRMSMEVADFQYL